MVLCATNLFDFLRPARYNFGKPPQIQTKNTRKAPLVWNKKSVKALLDDDNGQLIQEIFSNDQNQYMIKVIYYEVLNRHNWSYSQGEVIYDCILKDGEVVE